jgi:hypothetical protein
VRLISSNYSILKKKKKKQFFSSKNTDFIDFVENGHQSEKTCKKQKQKQKQKMKEVSEKISKF